MPAPRKTRPLKLADGSTFRIGPRTVSVPVTMEQNGITTTATLHINPSGGVLERGGERQLAAHVSPDAVVAIVEGINARRAESGQPPVVVPPTIRRLAKHSRQWGTPPWHDVGDRTGYPGRLPHTTTHTLWVNNRTGKCQLWEPTAENPEPALRAISRRDAVAWLHANGYGSVPTMLVAAWPGVANETPPAGNPTDGG